VPYENCDMAMSKNDMASFRGTANHQRIVTQPRFARTHGGRFASCWSSRCQRPPRPRPAIHSCHRASSDCISQRDASDPCSREKRYWPLHTKSLDARWQLWMAGRGRGVVGICWTNTMPNLPPWGASEPRLGNNPLVIAVPRNEGHIVLDMAMSQFSYGTLESYRSAASICPSSRFDLDGNLTAIRPR